MASPDLTPALHFTLPEVTMLDELVRDAIERESGAGSTAALRLNSLRTLFSELLMNWPASEPRERMTADDLFRESERIRHEAILSVSPSSQPVVPVPADWLLRDHTYVPSDRGCGFVVMSTYQESPGGPVEVLHICGRTVSEAVHRSRSHDLLASEFAASDFMAQQEGGVVVYPGGKRTIVPADVCRCPVLDIGDGCPVHMRAHG